MAGRATWTMTALGLLLLGLGACGGDGRRGGGGGGGDGGTGNGGRDAAPRRCDRDEDCDDGLECTLDQCAVGNVCRNRPVDALCPDGQSCLPGVGEPPSGCAVGEACSRDEDCDDGLECTVDGCGADGTCRHDPLDALCPDGQRCEPTEGCTEPMACMVDDDCDDGRFCNGRETCSAEFGCQPAAAPPACDDGDPCTIDGCSDELGRCTFTCDASNPACECPVETPCSGTFELSPVPMGSCAFGMVAYNVQRVTFSCVGPVLSVDGGSIPSAAMNTPMTQNPRPTDGSFDVEVRIEGGCTEVYRLQGSFTGPDTFSATFTATYSDSDGVSCAVGGCANRSWMVTGTRVP